MMSLSRALDDTLAVWLPTSPPRPKNGNGDLIGGPPSIVANTRKAGEPGFATLKKRLSLPALPSTVARRRRAELALAAGATDTVA
jgi:hypothetical protein